ncbi:D-glycero-beta-D-manno-heptose 1,7-bisphosphate 7-phosphatase [Salinicola avicenniae]|uniref:D-glycero-beta-D-manno-heptose 1,7-bisphosphate 7-phosphatase n=1 Tax=Salinicola avicenniae TaxID=2916836 RepID=UPI0020735EBA|nr:MULTISPECIES: D-glycero-beta-D-manno-heptose 1,7-bisphosphate 7-phosphatase [unclassified Salinicola]
MPNEPGIVILDRDGVINRDSDAYIKSVDEWQVLPGAIEAIARLSQAGWRVAVATNQSGIGRGYYDTQTLSQIHRLLVAKVEAAGGQLERIEYCPHLPDAGCRCRKPNPGMLERILSAVDRNAVPCWMVGDSLRDLEAGLAAHCRTALVLTGNGKATRDKLDRRFTETWICDDLHHFATRLLSASD